MSESYKPDWWAHPLPDYLGKHPTNYVLNVDEVEAVTQTFSKMLVVLNKEGEHVSNALRAMRTQRVPAYLIGTAPPRPVTMNDVLTVMLTLGNMNKLLLEIMTAAAQKRKDVDNVNLKG